VVAAEHTGRAAGPQLLHHIRQAAGLKPHVSVVVPNYNYERFLPERLQSILDQTFQDFELILLDDVSKDGSVAILEDCARRRPCTRVVVNEKNSGSPFAQWLRGMDMARSDLIWMAEADDACAPDLLATLLPALEDRNVFMAYVKSVPIGTEGQVYGDYEDIYLNRIREGRWSQPYLATDHEEAQSGLGIANCIPNASSLVFRRFEIEPDFAETLKGMRLCGDWFFYVRAMRGGMVAYSNRPLNLHRRHAETVTKTTEGSSRYFSEFGTVRDYIRAHYRQGEATRAVIERFTTEDLDRFGVTDEAARTAILAQAAAPHEAKPMPTVMVVVSDLSPGGGQMFGIRLANGWARRGGRAILVNARHFPDHPQVVSQVDPAVALFHADSLPMSVPELVARFDVDVVHSSIWWADRFVQDHIDALPGLPWIVTMHGCHETMLDNPQIDLSFPDRFKAMLGRVQAWVPTAEKNKRVFKRHGEPARQTRIVNGIEVKPAAPLSRDKLGLREDALVLCLATRAIEEKGWFAAVEMVKRLNADGLAVDLMLIGEGPAADAVAAEAPPYVRLYGQVANLQDYIVTADVGLLPSFFAGESMPLVLLEMMAQGLPVIATDVGDIPVILGEGPQAGGAIVPLKGKTVDVDGFVAEIRKLATPAARQAAGARAKTCFEKTYTMDGMVGAYRSLYRDALS
jgi:glycosyltransferase involved in cell wall biosynthesis